MVDDNTVVVIGTVVVTNVVVVDGTVVVVEGGSKFINSEIVITVNRVLQTGSGKMVFAQPRS